MERRRERVAVDTSMVESIDVDGKAVAYFLTAVTTECSEVDCYYKSVAFHDNVDDDNAFCSVSQDLRRCFWNF